MALMVVLALSAPVLGAFIAAPKAGQVAVMFDPSLSQSEIMTSIAQTDSRLVRFGGWSSWAIVDLSDEHQRKILKSTGALVFADPFILGGCSAPKTLEV
jgi:hypothetical protein